MKVAPTKNLVSVGAGLVSAPRSENVFNPN
jgi:hypothetical protein